MSYKNFYNSSVTSSSFSTTTSNFDTWWSNNRSSVGQGLTSGYDYTNPTTTSKRFAGKVVYKLAKRTVVLNPQPSFYQFKTGDILSAKKANPESNSTYYIKKSTNASYGVAPKFEKGESGGSGYIYCIKLTYTNGTEYYYMVGLEIDQSEDVIEAGTKVAPVPNSFEPYEPISFNTEPYINVTAYNSVYNSNSITKSGETTGVAYYDVDSYYTRVGSNEIDAYYNGKYVGYTNIYISDWRNKTYSIEATGNFKAYAGIAIDNNFASAFSLKLTKTNDYHTSVETVQTGLTLANIILTTASGNNKIFKSGENIAFTYSYSGNTITFATITPVITVANDWYANLGISEKYNAGEWFILNDIKSEVDTKTIKYQDGSVFAISDIASFTSLTTTLPLDSNGKHYLTEDDVLFGITYTINSLYFTNPLTRSIQAGTDDYSEDYYDRAVLVTDKHSFLFGETLELQSTDYIKFLNKDGDEVGSRVYLTSQNISIYIQGFTGYGQAINEKVDQQKRVVFSVTPFAGRTLSCEYTYVIDYYEESLKATHVHSVSKYYWDEDGIKYTQHLVFPSSELLELVKVKHTNSTSLGSKVEEEIDLEDCSIIMPDTDLISDIRTTENINISIDGNQYQTLTYSYPVEVVKYAPERLEIVGTGDGTKYFDNDNDLFHNPTGLIFNIIYTDNSEEEIEDYTQLEFYRNYDGTTLMNKLNGSSIIKSSDGNVIYVKDTVTGTIGFYTISWKADPIVSIDLGEKIYPFYGNKLRRMKQTVAEATIICTHESGVTSIIDDVNDFEFVEAGIIHSTGTFHLLIDGQSYTIPSNKIEFQEPYSKIEFVTDNFQTTYNNQADAIDGSKLGVEMHYYEDDEFEEECDYFEELSFTGSSTVSSYTQFGLNGTGILVNYVFNGQNKLNITMPTGQSETTGTFQVIAKDRYTNSSLTTTFNVLIIEILNITGIKLLNAKTEYNIGEEFLNSEDDTKIMVFYDDAQNQHRTIIVNLNSGLTALNIYPLKGTILNTIQTGIVITITSATNYNVSVQYAINVKANIVYSNTKTHNLVALYIPAYLGIQNKYFLVERTVVDGSGTKESTKINSDGERVINDGLDYDDLTVLGYLDDIGDTSKSARVILFKDYVSPIQGSNNVTVKFPCYKAGNADLINKCKFGIMFGNNNSKNRLFFSGNTDYPNKDWHSGQVRSDNVDDSSLMNGNFGYFEDLSECSYGETDNAVVGYDIVSNDKLLVLKSESDKETTVYFRQPQLVTAINSSGTSVTGLDDETLYQEEFSLVKGNNSVAGLSPKGILNFNGDTLFVSNDKQLCGLDLTGIIGDNQRYANSRSYYIDEDLKRFNLKNAFLWSNNKYLFLILDTKVYVTHYETKGGETSQYEWFAMNIGDISAVFEKDGIIYFGNNSGELFKFNDLWKDAKKIFIGFGALKLDADEESELIIAHQEIELLEENKKYSFRPVPLSRKNSTDDEHIYYNVGSITNSSSSDCDFTVDGENNPNSLIELVARRNGSTDQTVLKKIQDKLGEKEPIFLNRISGDVQGIDAEAGSELLTIQGIPMFLKEYEDFSNRILYQAFYEDGRLVPMNELRQARICKRLEREAEVTNIDKTNSTFQLKLDNEILDLVQYNTQSLVNNFAGEIIEYSNVEAFYITAPYTMGSLEYFKTIWSFTLTNDTNIPSELELCYVSNKVPYENMKTLAHISKDMLGFDLNDFNFNTVDFDKNVVPRTYTNKRVLSGVKFLCFGFRNYNDSNSVLSSMTVTYTTPYPSYSGD